MINTIGPFTETALTIPRACTAGMHYVDLSKEVFSVIDLLALHQEAVASNRTFVTGAELGVLATECLVLKMCEGQSPAAQVRTDAGRSRESGTRSPWLRPSLSHRRLCHRLRKKVRLRAPCPDPTLQRP